MACQSMRWRARTALMKRIKAPRIVQYRSIRCPFCSKGEVGLRRRNQWWTSFMRLCSGRGREWMRRQGGRESARYSANHEAHQIRLVPYSQARAIYLIDHLEPSSKSRVCSFRQSQPQLWWKMEMRRQEPTHQSRRALLPHSFPPLLLAHPHHTSTSCVSLFTQLQCWPPIA